jgi:hypothetical protein
VNELLCFLKEWKAQKIPLLHVGRGSNLLFVSDYQGTVLHSGIKGMQVVSETDEWVEIRVGAEEVEDVGDLHRGELLAVLAVTGGGELLEKVGDALDPSHQVSTGYCWSSIGKIQES